MGFINRFLLLIYALAVACLALGVATLALQIVPESMLLNEYRYLMTEQQWPLVAGGIVAFLLSIHLIGCSFSSGAEERTSGDLLVLHGKVGDVSVSLDAVHNLVEQTASTIAGVRSLKVKVSVLKTSVKEEARLALRIAIVIGKETNAAAVGDDIRAEVQRYMQETLGVDDFAMDVVVEDISNAPLAKKKRVV